MSARSSSLLGYGLYFIDVLACLLFCVTLALVGARFGEERTLPVDLPRLEPGEGAGSDLSGTPIAIRRGPEAEPEVFLGEEPVTLAELRTRLDSAPPLRVVVRSEESTLAQVIAIAHAAGVHDIQVAYDAAESGDGRRETLR